MGCLVALDRPILTMLSLGYQNLISLAKRVVDFDLTYSGNLYSQGAMSFVWVLIFRKYHVWAGWNCAYSWSCQVCCRASCSNCAYRYVGQISTIATKYILYYFLLEGPQNPLLSLLAWYYSLFILKYCGYSFKHFILVNRFMVFSSPSPDVHES